MKMLKIILFIGLINFLFGCSTNSGQYTYDATYTSQKQIKSISRKLDIYDVDIIEDDEFVTLILPNKVFFNNGSANFTSRGRLGLKLIADFMSHYEKSVVSVMGFISSGSSYAIAEAIAAERASRVVVYLWSSGIDANFMYADAEIIDLCDDDQDLLDDSVVIRFQKLKSRSCE